MISILCSTVHPRYCGSDGRHRFRVRAISRSGKESRGTHFTYLTNLLYYFKITDTDRAMRASGIEPRATQFTCFTNTKVQILTRAALFRKPTRWRVFAWTTLQVLSSLALLVQNYRSWQLRRCRADSSRLYCCICWACCCCCCCCCSSCVRRTLRRGFVTCN